MENSLSAHCGTGSLSYWHRAVLKSTPRQPPFRNWSLNFRRSSSWITSGPATAKKQASLIRDIMSMTKVSLSVMRSDNRGRKAEHAFTRQDSKQNTSNWIHEKVPFIFFTLLYTKKQIMKTSPWASTSQRPCTTPCNALLDAPISSLCDRSTSIPRASSYVISQAKEYFLLFSTLEFSHITLQSQKCSRFLLSDETSRFLSFPFSRPNPSSCVA